MTLRETISLRDNYEAQSKSKNKWEKIYSNALIASRIKNRINIADF